MEILFLSLLFGFFFLVGLGFDTQGSALAKAGVLVGVAFFLRAI
jgi:hypothetical protein